MEHLDPLTTLNNSVGTQQPCPTETDDTLVNDCDNNDNPLQWREVWRPVKNILPKEETPVIVSTRNRSIFIARLRKGEFVRYHHGVWVPVAEPELWIPTPYLHLENYFQMKVNADIPLEVVFGYLLKERNIYYVELKNYKEKNNVSYAHLQRAVEGSERKNAELVTFIGKNKEEIKQLSDLLAERNDELQDKDEELNQCYASISDLKHQLKDSFSSEEKAKYDATIVRMKNEIANLTAQNTQLRTNNAEYKKRITEITKQNNDLRTHSVVPQISAQSSEYIVKYNLLSTKYTKLRKLCEKLLNICENKTPVEPSKIESFRAVYNDAMNTTVTTTAPTPLPISDTNTPEPPKPRIIHIPRSNFLRIPHVGEGTLSLIEPLLKRFNVILT